MPLESSPDDATRPSNTRRPPPNYQTKGARRRLFVLVASLMTVLVAMNEARKPQTWAWLWHGQDSTATAPEPIETRLSESQEPNPSGPAFPTSEPLDQDARQTPADPNSHSARLPASSASPEQFAWQAIWDSLTYHERTQLARLLRAARLGKNSTPEDSRDWQPLVAKLDAAWNDLLTEQNRELLVPEAAANDPSRRRALLDLTERESKWNFGWKPAFDAAGESRSWTDQQRAALVELEATIERLALKLVRDDTVWRADERMTWFRLIEKLQAATATELAGQSVGKVGFVQIFRQSDEYRGRVVTIRGTARLAYRVSAPTNDLGIEEFCLFWLQPEDGTNLPIVVYALEPPTGFPRLTKDQQKIREPLEVTGYFFKRWVYRAGDGLNSVPLIVTRQPGWLPKSSVPVGPWDRLTARLGRAFWPVLSAGILLLVLFAGGLTWLISRSGRRATGNRVHCNPSTEAHWEQLPATPSVEESLRKLETRND